MKKTALSIITVLAVAALSVSAYPPPEDDEISIRELKNRLREFDGKVVEVEVTYVYDINPSSRGKYSVYCNLHKDGHYDGDGTRITFTNDKDGDALEFFEDLFRRRHSGSRASFYVLVEGKKITAIGEKYKKSKGSYRW